MQRLNTGQIINNRYRIVSLISLGGFGAVYRAWDMNLNAPCALKLNIDPLPEGAQQFAREASLLANLRHPNLPRVLDHFIIPGEGQYLVMEFIAGQDLQEMIDAAGPLQEAQVLGWARQVLDALIYLHNQNPPVVHRDIKPANVRITPEGMAVLVDFGIAKLYDPLRKTTLGARATTPGFAPVEQYGQAQTDSRSDIYSLGATLYNALTGQPPPESLALAGGMPLKTPRQINSSIHPSTEAVVLKAMQVLPEKRYQTAQEFKTALPLIEQPGDSATQILPHVTVYSPARSTPAPYPATMAVPVSEPTSRPRQEMQPVGVPSQPQTPPYTPPYTPPPVSIPPSVPASVPASAPARRLSPAMVIGIVIAAVVLLALCALGGWYGLSTEQTRASQRQASQTAVQVAQEQVRQTDAALRVLQGAKATLDARQSSVPPTSPATVAASPTTTQALNTATATLQPATEPASPTTSSLEPVSFTDFKLFYFVRVSSKCKDDSTLCFKLNDDWSSAQGGMDAYLTGEQYVYIDPAWPNPYLVFWTDFDIKNDAWLDVGWDSSWQTVRTYSGGSGFWRLEAINISHLKGKEITVRFTAFIGDVEQSKWFINGIQVVPNYTP